MLTLSGAPGSTSNCGYFTSVPFGLLHHVVVSSFGKSSWLMHVDF